MRTAWKLRRAAICGCVVLVLLSGCTAEPEPLAAPSTSQPTVSTASPTTPRQGPPASWSVPFAAPVDVQSVTAVGDVILLDDVKTLRAVSRSSGGPLWSRDRVTTYRVASGAVVLWVRENASSSLGRVETIDVTSGKTLWRADRPSRSVVYQDAVYLHECKGRTACTITRRDVRDGRVRWRLPATVGFTVSSDAIGVRSPTAPSSGRYIAAGIGSKQQPWVAVEASSGKAMPGRAEYRQWYTLVAGSALVVTDHDSQSGNCAIRLNAVKIETGAPSWSGTVYNGRRKNGDCDQSVTELTAGTTMIGAGHRIAAATAAGKPQLFDLTTGRTVWTGADPGVPIDGDRRSILVREHADEGKLAVLDLATGRARGSVPDPGIATTSASWRSAVTAGLIAVNGSVDRKACVLVYDAGSGRQLGRIPGWFAGAGDDWVAVTDQGRLDMIRF